MPAVGPSTGRFWQSVLPDQFPMHLSREVPSFRVVQAGLKGLGVSELRGGR